MTVVAICLVLLSFVLRRRYRQRTAMLAAQQQEQLAALAARDAAAMEAAARVAQRSGVVPVIIVQPDGDITLAEKHADTTKQAAAALPASAALAGTPHGPPGSLPPAFVSPPAAQGGPPLEARHAALAV
jgi:hypothetical protein